MKNRIAWLVLVFFCLLPVLSSAATVKLIIKGGINYSSIGNWNTYLKYWDDYNKRYYSQNGYTATGGLNPLHFGPAIEAELSLNITPRLAVSIGTEYLIAQHPAGEMPLTGKTPDGQVVSSRGDICKLSAIPLKITLAYYPLESGHFRAFVKAGAGYYFARFRDTAEFDSGLSSYFERTQGANSGGIGFHGGLGVEIAMGGPLSFLAELEARNAKISGFEGSGTWKEASGASGSWSGRLYYYEWLQSEWTTFVFIEEKEPAGANYRNVRDAAVDFSGVAFKAGFIFRF